MRELPKLTDRQRQVYAFIEDRIREWGFPPTIREIGEHLGIRSTNGVSDHLKALKRKGYLTQKVMKSRTLQVVTGGTTSRDANNANRAAGPSDITASHIDVPILGKVAAGEPILAEENAEERVLVDAALVGHKPVFALRVVGESMIDDGIHHGDVIFVQKKCVAEAGAIVVVLLDDAATVKRFYPEGDRICLRPANTTMQPIYIEKSAFCQTQILGVVVGVYHHFF